VPKGQVLGMLGQNGAGKTTFLNLMSGYLPLSQGSIQVCGCDIAREPLKAKSHIGFLPENPPLYPEMTVYEYLRFCCAIKRVRQKEHTAHIDQIAHMTGLIEVLGRRISNLSKGFRQRVGLAQALCGSPDVLLLDEPTSGFDPSQAVDFRGIISSLSGKHTIIISSHILTEVQAMCDRVIILHQGRLLYDHPLTENNEGEQSARFHLRVKMPRQALLRALRSLPSVLRVEPTAARENETDVTVDAKTGYHFEEELFTLLSGLQVPILRLTPMAESMEDIFLRITSPSTVQGVSS
jgi:ABC-2 type transport system ATP-binding protein